MHTPTNKLTITNQKQGQYDLIYRVYKPSCCPAS